MSKKRREMRRRRAERRAEHRVRKVIREALQIDEQKMPRMQPPMMPQQQGRSGGMDPMQAMVMMQMGMPLIQTAMTTLKGAFSGFGQAEEDRLTQMIQQNPRIADASELYAATAGKLGTDEDKVRTLLTKNSGDLAGFSRDFTTAVATITNGKETGELVTVLKDEGMEEEADTVLAAVMDQPQSGQQAPPPQMPPAQPPGAMPPGPGQPSMGQKMPMREARVRKLIRQELLKIL